MSMNLNPEPTVSKKSKNYKKTLRVGGAISLIGVGSTFAANITLNGDQNVEFGQGVAQTASCDSDGFFVNPVSYYDNTSGTFRLDYVEVSGLNLIPVGAISGSYDASASPQYQQYGDASVIAAHPGQYYNSDNNTWTNTCDQVVLDFKAYTDQEKYSTNTVDGHGLAWNHTNTSPNTISSPLLWAVESNDGLVHVSEDGSTTSAASNPNMAIIFNASAEDANEAVLPEQGYYWGFNYSWPDDSGETGFVKESSFKLFTNGGHHDSDGTNVGSNSHDPAAGPISKITVESMKYFPTDYYLFNNASDALGKKQTS